MLDNGAADEKIICIPLNDPTYNIYKDISELPKHIFDEMCHFFSVYKALEHKDTVVDDVKDREHATEIVAQWCVRFFTAYCISTLAVAFFATLFCGFVQFYYYFWLF